MRIPGWPALCAALSLSAAQRPVTLADVFSPAASRAGHMVPLITWSADGKRFIVNEQRVLSVYDVRSGRTRELLPLSKLADAAVKTTPSPTFEWTNRNIAEQVVQWFPDNRHILVSAGGDLFILDTDKATFEPLTQTASAERDPKLAPDGHAVSFRVNHNLQVLDLTTRTTRVLTKDGSPTLLNGEPDWIYPEELDLKTAYWWSPDSRLIAYLQFDVSREPLFPQVSLLSTRGLAEPERYPKAGDPNADVRLGVVPATGGQTRWMDLGDPRDHLFPRVVWSPDSREILAMRLNRIQTRLDYLLADTTTATSRVLIHEEDPKWLNVRDTPVFLSPRDLLYVSERTGFSHLYVRDISSGGDRQLTSGNWEVERIVAVMPFRDSMDVADGRILFTSSEGSPLERQLCSVRFNGTGRFAMTAGAGTHSVSVSPAFDFFLDDHSGLRAAPRSTLNYLGNVSAPSAPLRVYRAASESGDLQLLPVQVLTMKTADGAELYARMILPPDFRQDRKYPAIAVVYGGPGSQQIKNTWSGATWEQVLASKGFVVWQLDNRGSTGRGHQFESAIYHNLGKQELADQREGIDFLVGKGFVDRARIGMYGWSYGGFMTLYTATNAPGLLKAAVAGAPVTDWRNYDSIYTERYMGLPDEDPEAYRLTSPQTRAGDLKGTRLMMIHNIEDDNVHFQNTVQMADALERANIPFSMLVYPGKSHGVTGTHQRHLLEQITQFFEENLK